jgi:hypothetical protein
MMLWNLLSYFSTKILSWHVFMKPTDLFKNRTVVSQVPEGHWTQPTSKQTWEAWNLHSGYFGVKVKYFLKLFQSAKKMDCSEVQNDLKHHVVLCPFYFAPMKRKVCAFVTVYFSCAKQHDMVGNCWLCWAFFLFSCCFTVSPQAKP